MRDQTVKFSDMCGSVFEANETGQNVMNDSQGLLIICQAAVKVSTWSLEIMIRIFLQLNGLYEQKW